MLADGYKSPVAPCWILKCGNAASTLVLGAGYREGKNRFLLVRATKCTACVRVKLTSRVKASY